MVKKILFVTGIVILVAVAAVFIYWHRIIQYSADVIIRKALPDFVKIEKINLNPEDRTLYLDNLSIISPPGFSGRYLIEIGRFSCSYKMRGDSFLDGIEIIAPKIKDMVFNIERTPGGKVNIQEMGGIIEKRDAPPVSKVMAKARGEMKLPGGRAASDIIKLPEEFVLENGKIIFLDRALKHRKHIITLDDMNGTAMLKLDDSYSKVLWVETKGEGFLDGNKAESVRWTISIDPTAKNLTMSSRFEVEGLDLLVFEPYYDKYSPFVVKNGIFSGTLIFDFNNGNIGSSNEIRLSDLRFTVKPGYENGFFMGTTVQDMVKYFTSPYGEIVFDFKIKGDMKDPKFFLGPKSKEAITSMAIDKVSDVVEKMSKGKDGAAGSPKSDIEKAQEYINLFKGIIDKK